MISIASYAKGKKSSSSSSNGGGGFANTVIKNTNGISPFYLWGQYIDGRDDINGDLISNGTINGNKLVAPQGNIDLIYALSEYVNYISGHTAIFDNLSGDTAHFNQDVFVGGDIDIEGDTNIGGDTVIEGDLSVSGDTHLTNLWTENITNSDTIKTKNLEVSGLAHFFQLVIDKIKSAGGAILLTPADGFETALVEEDASGYTLYFHAKDGEKQISNMWEVNDQAICQTFNASTGTSYNVSNTYYWALVTEVSEQAVEKTVSGVTNEYHYIKLSKSTYDGVLNPKVGDEIAMLGSRNNEDPQRQSAIYLSAYVSLDQGLTAPCFAEYKGINDFSLSSHRHSYIDATGASFYGDFRIDSNTTIQDYVNSATTEVRNEFRFDTEGLYSRVSKMTNPNILPANGWTDQNGKALLQEDDEEFIFEEPQEESLAKGGFSEEVVDEDYIGKPPIIYLNADTYTFSTYSHVKYEDIQYGQAKDNLNLTLPVQTAFISGDTWHNEERAVTTFIAPINGYYKFGAKLMDNSYTGDYEWVEPEDEGGSGYTPSEDSAITTTIEISMSNSHKITATITPSNFGGTVVWSSSNPSVATIDQQGNLTKVGSGTTTISASIPEQYWNGKHYLGSSDNLGVTVQTPQINYTPIPIGFEEGDTHNLSASTVPAGGTLTYTSSNPSVASVNSSGIVTALAYGTTTITINCEAFSDTVNNIICESASTSVSVDVLGDFNPLTDSEYFVIKSVSGSPQIQLEKKTTRGTNLYYRKNGQGGFQSAGSTLNNKTYINLQNGDYLELKGNLSGDTYNADFNITSTGGTFEVGGYLMALCRNEEITGTNNYLSNSEVLAGLFRDCEGIVSAQNLQLAENTTSRCYQGLFHNCSNLVAPPELPLPSVENWAYAGMFGNCVSLTTAPELPATTLGIASYYDMFRGCSGLTEAPDLPATSLTQSCYENMFQDCTSLTTGPSLPATNITQSCYYNMFRGCTSLTSLTVSFVNYDSSTYATYNWLSSIYTTGVLYAPSNRTWTTQDVIIPQNWRIENFNPLRDSRYFVIKATRKNPTLYIKKYGNAEGSMSYRKNGGGEWTTVSATTTISLNVGNYLEFKGNINNLNSGGTWVFYVNRDYDIKVGGYLMSLNKNKEIDSSNNTIGQANFRNLFDGCLGLKSAEDLKLAKDVNRLCYASLFSQCNFLVTPPQLPATTLAEKCYQNMFGGCGLTTAPALPATTLAPSCYKDMFKSSTLTTAPALPATTLSDYCYEGMFYWCKSLTTPPVISATTLAKFCCYEMFYDCDALTTAPELPATNLAPGCYSNMFIGCDALTTAPALPATTLIKGCYKDMFRGCSGLTEAPELPAIELADSCYEGMFYACESLSSLTVSFVNYDSSTEATYTWLSSIYTTGVLYAPANRTWTTQDVTIPQYWRIENTTEYNPLTDSEYFVIKSVSGSPTVTVNKNGSPTGSMSYRKNGSGSWTSINTTTSISTQEGDYLEFKGDINNSGYENCYTFSTNIENSIEAGGWLMALSKNGEVDNGNNTIGNSKFWDLFSNCSGLVSAQHLKMASDTYEECYSYMFSWCTNLVLPPELPATTLAVHSYGSMFFGCTSLTNAPELPATILAPYCYDCMFFVCESLTNLSVKFLTSSNFGYYLDGWLNDISTQGTLYCPSNATYSASDLGLPNTWTLSKTL